MLTFVIPTHNRPLELRRAVLSIAEQIVADGIEAKILILDNGSDEETDIAIGRLKSEYPCIRSERFEDNQDYSLAFYRMMLAASESEWVWTFGDDDYLMNGALKFMVEQLERLSDADFIHVAEVSRVSGSSGCYRGTLLDLCNQFGWIEMTGFITGNIIRGWLLAESALTSRWTSYAETAFVHSCALLETLHAHQAVFLDLPIVNTQAKEQTQECIRSWLSQNIPTRYLYTSDAVAAMFSSGILKDKLSNKFFRYLDYHLWDRFLISALNDYNDSKSLWLDEAWPHILKFADLIADQDMAAQIRADAQGIRSLTALHSYLSLNLSGLQSELEAIGARHGFIYPYTYVPPQAPSDALTELEGVSNEIETQETDAAKNAASTGQEKVLRA